MELRRLLVYSPDLDADTRFLREIGMTTVEEGPTWAVFGAGESARGPVELMTYRPSEDFWLVPSMEVEHVGELDKLWERLRDSGYSVTDLARKESGSSFLVLDSANRYWHLFAPPQLP